MENLVCFGVASMPPLPRQDIFRFLEFVIMDKHATAEIEKVGKLIEQGRVHGSLYTDEAIFQAELENIWYKSWVYVGHESEVPDPNDFIMKSIGPQSVIMTRSADGEIHLLQNRCPHRGNEVCQQKSGNAKSFTCPFHKWTFANTGELTATAFADGYEGQDIKELGLSRVARTDSYRGFVFGSFAEKGTGLKDFLGGAARTIDQLCDNSPTGEIEITTGFLKHRVKANWKFVVENETDGYHPAFVHASIFSVAESGIGALYGPKSTALARDFGNGHTEIDPRPEFRRLDQPLGWFGTTEDRLPDYSDKMRAEYGEDRAREIMIDGTPHVMIFPNLFIAEIQMFVLQPLAVDDTVQHVTALQFKGAPDINRRLRQQTMGSVGPAGFLLADDAEMYERSHRGVLSRDPEWLYLKRGNHRERQDESGFIVGHATDEVPSRGIWAHYRSQMEAK
jgi:phenylpropionate dioxygenase-like ring-hydroxylating dioxygenase large terminal subunit